MRGFMSPALTLYFSGFRFYLCLFSGPSTFLPKVRDPEFAGSCPLDSLLVGLGLVPVGRTQGWVALPSGVGQVG